jgi:acyl-coenzyme A synthetase/AMP-(fatty) acid ligase
MSFNASTYLLDRHIDNGDGDRLALTGVRGELTYAELHDRVRRTAGGLRRAGLLPEQRLLMFMADSPEFVTVFLAALRIGAVPVPVSTMMRVDGLAALLADSRAPFLAVTAEFSDLAAQAGAARVLGPAEIASLAASPVDSELFPTSEDSPAFWLYTS